MEKGLRNATQIGDLRTLGAVEFMHGSFFDTKGDWELAAEHLQKSIQYGEKVGYLPLLAWSWTWLGHALFSLGDPESGKRHVEKGLEIQRKGGFEMFLSTYPFYLGDIYLHMGDLKNARSFMDEALRLSQENNEKFMEGLTWIFLGRILGRMETPQVHHAEEYIFRGMKILDELKLKPYCARGHFFLGELYTNANQQEKALDNLKEAEMMFQQMGMDYWLGRTREVLAAL